MPEEPIFAGKTLFLQFLKLYFIFFHEISHNHVKWQWLKLDQARFSKILFYRPKMPEIYRKNRLFGIFSRFHHLLFLIFCTKMHIRNVQNTTESDFWENFFFWLKIPEIAVCTDFRLTFPYISFFRSLYVSYFNSFSISSSIFIIR